MFCSQHRRPHIKYEGDQRHRTPLAADSWTRLHHYSWKTQRPTKQCGLRFLCVRRAGATNSLCRAPPCDERAVATTWVRKIMRAILLGDALRKIINATVAIIIWIISYNDCLKDSFSGPSEPPPVHHHHVHKRFLFPPFPPDPSPQTLAICSISTRLELALPFLLLP